MYNYSIIKNKFCEKYFLRNNADPKINIPLTIQY